MKIKIGENGRVSSIEENGVPLNCVKAVTITCDADKDSKAILEIEFFELEAEPAYVQIMMAVPLSKGHEIKRVRKIEFWDGDVCDFTET